MLTLVACSALALAPALATSAAGRPSDRPVPGAAQRRAGVLADRLLRRLLPPGPGSDAAALCAAICAELRAGAAPDRALLNAAQQSVLVPRARAAALLGEPVAPALADDAAASGSCALAGAAACWAVAAHTGAGLAEGLDRVAGLARSERRLAADLAAETAAPRATARVLSLLPVLGLLLGEMLGAHPVQWLLGGPLGWLCLAGGSGFLLVGRLWARRIVRRAVPEPSQGRR